MERMDECDDSSTLPPPSPPAYSSESRADDDWDGEDDPDNPQNWPSWKRSYHSMVPTCFAFLCTFGSSVYTPGDQAVAAELGVSRVVSLLPFVVYLLGLSFGPVMAAPMSETYGRRIVYRTAVPISGLFTLGAGFSQHISSLTVCRFFAGLLSSPGLSIGTGTIADVWRPHERSLPMTAFITSVQMGPALGPLIGGFVVERESWRWTQWVMLFALATVIGLTLPMSETYKKEILKRRAKRRGLKPPPEPRRSTAQAVAHFVKLSIQRPLHMLFTETIVTFYDLYVGTNFGILNGFFAAFPYVFSKVYGFDIGSIGLTFLGQAVGSLSGFLIVMCYDVYYYQPRARVLREKAGPHSKLEAEQRLGTAMMGAPMLPISLFWFAWTARTSVHWIVPVAAEAFFSCGNLLVFSCAGLYLTDCYGARYGASAWSSNTFVRYLFAAAVPLFIIQMYEGLGIAWATSLLGFVTLVLMLVPFAFWRYGSVLRQKSSYAPEE